MTAVAIRTQALPEKVEYARFLAASGLLPAQYRERPANILYATEYGEMLGLPPMAAINGIHVIEGKPSASAALISALVRRAGHRLRITGDDDSATCEIVRHDDLTFTFRSTWTVERARNAGLLGKDVWKKYRAAMLKARALTECARDACQEALSGLQYTPEELGAQVDEEGLPVQATATPLASPAPADPGWASKPSTVYERANGHPEPVQGPDGPEPVEEAAAAEEPDWQGLIAQAEQRADVESLRWLWRLAREQRPSDLGLRQQLMEASRRAKAAAKANTDAEPAAGSQAAAAVAEPEPLDAEVVDEQPATVTREQHAHMHALWAKAELADRDDRLAVTSLLVGRPIASSSELTRLEASKLIDRLVEFDQRGPAALYGQVSRWLDEAKAEPVDPPEEG